MSAWTFGGKRVTVSHPTEPGGLASRVALRPAGLADQLRHLAPADRALFRRFGWGPVAAPPYGLIHRAFEQQARVRPGAIAADHLGDTITYGELNRRANRLAAHLVGLGVRPGEHVGLFLRRSIPMLVGLLGVLKAGAGYVPQDVCVAPATQLRHVMRTAGTRVVLTQRRYADRVPAFDGHLITVDADPMVDAPAPATTGLDGDHGCYVLFTSGTTGPPNGVVVTHRNVCNLLLTGPGDLGIRPGWRVGQILNLSFDMAAWEILGTLSHGGTLVIRGGDIAETARTLDVLIATPTILSGLEPQRCPRIKVVAVAGEPCPRTLADRWAGRAVFYNGCGPTETTIVNTMQCHDPAAAQLTIGRPTPNNTVYVLGPDGRPCPIGEVGEMWAGGECVSAGYLGNPELTAERYRPDPFLGGDRLMFRTRDLGRWTADGELQHLGRTDDQVKIRGFRVELDSVSAVLEALPGCARAVTLKLDARSLVAFVAGDVDPEAAKQAVAEALPYYCVPAAVYTLPALPETSRGKIDKMSLLRLAGRLANGTAA